MERQLIDQRCPVQLGVSSDPLQPAEREHRVTLRVLKILADFEYPTVITTKFPDQLIEADHLRELDAMPLVVQCSISSVDEALLGRIEPGAPSLAQRLEALRVLADAGAHVQLRLWPFASDLCGDVARLLAMVKDTGVRTVLANPLKVYHAGGIRESINKAIGRDYLAATSLRYENHGLFDVPCHKDLSRELSQLRDLCRQFGLNLLNCDDCTGRNWQSCCGVDGLPDFENIAKWAYFVNGYRITQYTDFETYMRGHDCPWHDEFNQEWNKGKLSESIPELIFHKEDKTYSRLERCAEIPEKAESSKADILEL